MRHRLLRLASVLACVAAAPVAAQSMPKTGAEVLQRMHDAYAGKWYTTLSFAQKTTIRRRDGTDTAITWYESLRYTDAHGTQLRIDQGDLAAGNGVLYTADSTWIVRAGKLAATRPNGNEFLPLIEGVYMQPVARTMRELDSAKIDMQRVSRADWQGRRMDRRRVVTGRHGIDAILGRHRAQRRRAHAAQSRRTGPNARHSSRRLRPARERMAGNEDRDDGRWKTTAERGVLGLESERPVSRRPVLGGQME
jgi:hypothetical protein